jgi:hypothetical protein
MAIKSLNGNDRMIDLSGGDMLTPSYKNVLVNNYNSNILDIKNQLGYWYTQGTITRSAVSVINSALDTSGNGGRKVVRLDNGWIVLGVLDTSGLKYVLYYSTDFGATWQVFWTGSSQTSVQSISLATNGTYIYLLFSYNNANIMCAVFNQSKSVIQAPNIETGQTALGGSSMTYNPSDKTLHCAWASINSTYPNSYNIRYAKGTIANDGSVTWGTVTQVTTASTTGSDSKNPSVVMSGTNPLIIYSFGTSSSSNQQIKCYNVTNSTTTNVYSVTSTVYLQFSPSATVDGTGAIHVVWYGYDATDTAVYNVRYSKSTDGGATWSAMTKLTSGNTYHQAYPSITYDQNNNIYVYFSGRGSSNTDSYRIRSIIYNGSWGSITDITSNTTGQANMVYVSLCDNIRTFTSPLVTWQDNVSPSVKFSGTWTDITAQGTKSSIVDNNTLFNKLSTMASDSLTETQKTSLMNTLNGYINGDIQNQWGYSPTYGTTTNPSRTNINIVASANDVSKGGHKTSTRLKDGTLISISKSGLNILMYKSTDNGNTWSLLKTITATSSLQDASVTTNGKYIYLLRAEQTTSVFLNAYDVTGTLIGGAGKTIDSLQSQISEITITYNPYDKTLHMVSITKNSTYTGSWNLRYSNVSVNSIDGSLGTPSTVTQLTTDNSAGGIDWFTPCIIIRKDGTPFIVATQSYYTSGNGNAIWGYYLNGSSWLRYQINSGGWDARYSSHATVDSSGTIHVAFAGYDTTDTTWSNIRYTKSTDNGVTWSAMVKLTSGNTYGQYNPIIKTDQNNNIYIYWEGTTASSNGKYNIRSIIYNGSSWGSINEITTSTTADIRYPNFVEGIDTFTSPPVIWTDNVSPSVKFNGSWTDKPITNEVLSISAVSNKALIDGVIAKGIGKRYASGTVTSSSSTQTFTAVDGATTYLRPYVTITGLSFKPSRIVLFETLNPTLVLYSEDMDGNYGKTVKHSLFYNQNSNSTSYTYNYRGDVAPVSVINGSFTLPVYQSSRVHTWIAYE